MALLDVISYRGTNDILIHRHERTEFTTLSQLTVHESQEAVLFLEGKKLDTLPPGRHTMHTKNIPLLNKLVNLPFGGESPFRCEVYFVNKTITLNQKWGTASQVRVLDKAFNVLLNIGASGVIGLRVIDPSRVLLSIVGTEDDLTAEKCLDYFRSIITMKVKDYIAKIMRMPGMSFLLLEGSLEDFSKAVIQKVNEEFVSVGVEVTNFVIENIGIPEHQYRVIEEGLQEIQKAKFEAEAERIRAKGIHDSRVTQGYNWVDEQKAEIAKLYAQSGQMQGNPANLLAQAPLALAYGNMLRDNVMPTIDPGFSGSGIGFDKGSTGAQITEKNESIFGDFPDVAPLDDFDSGVSIGTEGMSADASVYCSECGSKLAAGDRFCRNCGKQIEEQISKCPNCGKAYSVADKFCTRCGRKRAR